MKGREGNEESTVGEMERGGERWREKGGGMLHF